MSSVLRCSCNEHPAHCVVVCIHEGLNIKQAFWFFFFLSFVLWAGCVNKQNPLKISLNVWLSTQTEYPTIFPFRITLFHFQFLISCRGRQKNHLRAFVLDLFLTFRSKTSKPCNTWNCQIWIIHLIVTVDAVLALFSVFLQRLPPLSWDAAPSIVMCPFVTCTFVHYIIMIFYLLKQLWCFTIKFPISHKCLNVTKINHILRY